MATNQLTYKETLTTEQFKNRFQAASIQPYALQKNGQTVRFFTAATPTETISGRVTRKFDEMTQPMMSLVSNEQGEEFWLLHQKGASNAVELKAF